MAKYWDPPPYFHPKFCLTKMTQNGLKWILNTTFFFFNEGFPYLLRPAKKDSDLLF